MNASADVQARLIRGLLEPAAYPHPVDRVEHRETHISHVLLAGEYAYKIKKPLDLGFLDFTTAERRAHYCAEEIRLNGRLAPGIYLDVVAITGTVTEPRIAGTGEVLEHAVRMQRFDDSRRLDRELQAGGLEAATVDDVASTIGRFHETLAADSPPTTCGTPEAVIAPMRENFGQIHPVLDATIDDTGLEALARWTEERWRQLRPVLARRRARGRVRECHGDMHLGNMARHDGGFIIFDGIEFNAALRWIDVASDIAFLVMDLDRLDAPAFAGRALDAWLATTGDYEALAVMRFYLVYRAMVRAKINAIRASQAGDEAVRAQARADYRRHVELARCYAAADAPALFLTRGVAGTGKSSAAACLVERIGAVRLRSDIERLRLYPDASKAVRYSEAASDAVHARLEALAATAIEAGWPVVVDATFIERRRRTPFLELARRLGVEARVLDLHVSPQVRDARIRARAAAGRDPSEADPAIAAKQERALDPLTPEERAITLGVDNDGRQPRVPVTRERHGRGLAPDQ